MAPSHALLTVTTTTDWDYNTDYNIQLHSRTIREEFPSLHQGDYVSVRNFQNTLNPELFGRVNVCDDIEKGEVGIGLSLRYALGVSTESDVEVYPHTGPDKHFLRIYFDRILKIRPLICRTRYSTHPDPGFHVCRISEDTKRFIGINDGDRVIVETPDERISLQALSVTAEFKTRKKTEWNQNHKTFPDCIEELSIEEIEGLEEDIPKIYLDLKARSQLGLTDSPQTGLCQPVRVYRDSWHAGLRRMDEVTTPLVLGLAGLILLFEEFRNLGTLVVISLISLVFIIGSLLYHSRNFTVG